MSLAAREITATPCLLLLPLLVRVPSTLWNPNERTRTNERTYAIHTQKKASTYTVRVLCLYMHGHTCRKPKIPVKVRWGPPRASIFKKSSCSPMMRENLNLRMETILHKRINVKCISLTCEWRWQGWTEWWVECIVSDFTFHSFSFYFFMWSSLFVIDLVPADTRIYWYINVIRYRL